MRKYRADIDGLRALAVVLVLVFHAGFSVLPGGFIGVDVFFVISGYLITDHLVEEIRERRFSLLEFYDRRIRRIVPALLVVLLASLVAGALILAPGAYAALAQSAGFAALGISNFFFFRNTGYFDGAAEAMPLLHTWSLGVEEQFYLAWPLLLWAAAMGSRRWRPALAVVVGLVIVLSFGLSVMKVAEGAKSAFYLPFGRAWELAAGGALVLLRGRLDGLPGVVVEGLKLIGLCLVCVPALLLTPASPFPGLNAVSPVLGAMLLVLPTPRRTLVSRLLAVPPFVFLGRISYSLYLWHWPILVLARQYQNDVPLSPAAAIACLAVSTLAAWASWRFVEQPFRLARWDARRVVMVGGAAGVIAAGVGFGIAAMDGLPGRLSPRLQNMASFDQMWQWPCRERIALPGLGDRLCVAGADWASAKTRGIIWGDSHAEHLMHLLDVTGRETSTSVALLRICPALFSTDGLKRVPVALPPECERTYRATLAMLKARPDINLVILASSWGFMSTSVYRHDGDPVTHEAGLKAMRETFLDLAPRLAAPGRRIVLFADIPHWAGGDPLPCLYARDGSLLRAPCAREVEMMGAADYDQIQRDVNEMFRSLKQERDDMVVAIPADALCKGSACLARFEGEYLYFDRDHLRRNLPDDVKRHFADLIGLKALIDVGQGTVGIGQ